MNTSTAESCARNGDDGAQSEEGKGSNCTERLDNTWRAAVRMSPLTPMT